MIGSRIAAGVAVLVAVLAISCVGSAASRRGERVSITGCVFAGTEAACLMIKAQDGSLYNISAVLPRPPRPSGRMIRVRGAVTDKVSACGQGIVLERIRWTRTRQRCPN